MDGPTDLREALRDLADLLAARAGADHELRDALARVSAAAAPAPAAPRDAWAIVPRIAAAGAPVPEEALAAPDTVREIETLRAVDIDRLLAWSRGEAPEAAEGTGAAGAAAIDDELAPLAERLRLKATGARWRAEGRPDAGLQRLRSRAGEVPGVDLWMLENSGGAPADWEILASAYGAAATAASVLAAFAGAGLHLARSTPFADAVDAAAQAQSGLRAAYWRLRGREASYVFPVHADEEPDQVALFDWLREATRVDQIYVERYMRWQDAADPADAPAIDHRLRAIAEAAGLRPALDDDDAVSGLLNTANYHARRVARQPWDLDDHARRLLEEVGDIVQAGTPATDVRLREVLLPVLRLLPEEAVAGAPAGATRVVEAVREHLARQEDDDDWAPDPAARHSPEVARAARLLRGRRIAVFGGVRRPEHVRALEEAFDATVEWVETRPHQSTAPFEPAVERADVAMLLIRWCSHSFEDIRGFCDAHDTMYVRLPAGYNPNQVARQVLEQVGDRLAARTATA